MTVKELIQKLSLYEDDLPVTILVRDGPNNGLLGEAHCVIYDNQHEEVCIETAE